MTSSNTSFKHLALFVACAFALSLSLAPLAHAMHEDDNGSSTAMSHCDNNDEHDGMMHHATSTDEHMGEGHHATSTDEHDMCDNNNDNHNDGEKKDDSHHGMSSVQNISHNLDNMSVPQLESLIKLLQQLIALILASKGA